MRLICTLHDLNQAKQFSEYLASQNIDHQIEAVENKDWGQDSYGSSTCYVWVRDEERFPEAMQMAQQFIKDPHDPQFSTPSLSPSETPSDIPSTIETGKENQSSLTRFFLIVCCFLFFVGMMTEPVLKVRPPPSIPATPLYSPPINKALMYDYPAAYELIDSLVDKYGIDAVMTPQALPEEGQKILTQFKNTPYWEGFYPLIVAHFSDEHAPLQHNAPLFEKIRTGEIWRIFTPAFLHNDIFHLFFNMIWLVVLGRQIEQRIGKWRYLLFILIAAVIPNTAQYLMSGPNFLGFSGILCAMLTFIWVRQRKTAWEGYQLERGTFIFISLFILLMFILQSVAFVLETQGNRSLSIGIANTAHLVGAATGLVLAKLNLFSWQKS